MFIGLAGVGLPSSVTVPVTDPAVEESTTFVAFELATGCSFVSVFSLPPQPAIATARTAASARLKNLVFIWDDSSLVERGYSNNSMTRSCANSFGAGMAQYCATCLRLQVCRPRQTMS